MGGATVTVAGAVPDAGLACSHAAPAEVVKLSVPLPVLDTAAVLLDGSLPPVVAVNDSDVGETPTAGGGGAGGLVTTRWTAIVGGEPVAPAAVTVTLVS